MQDAAFSAPGRFFKGNIHTHSDRSDGALPPAEVCRRYREAGYDFLSLTDHFQSKYGFPIVDTSTFRTDTFTTIPGAEVHAPATALGELWHILAVCLALDFAPTGAGETGVELAQRCLAAGAFVAIPHPTWYALSAADAATLPGAHAVEIYNHTSQVRTDRGDGSYLVDQLLADGRRVQLCATDDAHFHCEDAFGGFVMVKAERNEAEFLVEALKAGHYYSSQGPLIEEVVWSDGLVEVACSPATAVMALGRGSRAVQRLSQGMTKVTLRLGRVGDGGFVRLMVVDDAGRRAWTNPVWL